MSRRQAYTAAALEESRQRYGTARGQVNQYWGSMLDPMRTGLNNMMARGYETSNPLLRGRGVSGGAFRGGVGGMMGPLGLIYGAMGEGIRGDRAAPPINPFTSGPLGGFRERQYAQLMQYGPRPLVDPPTSYQGEEGAYGLRVRQQYEAEDRRARSRIGKIAF